MAKSAGAIHVRAPRMPHWQGQECPACKRWLMVAQRPDGTPVLIQRYSEGHVGVDAEGRLTVIGFDYPRYEVHEWICPGVPDPPSVFQVAIWEWMDAEAERLSITVAEVRERMIAGARPPAQERKHKHAGD